MKLITLYRSLSQVTDPLQSRSFERRSAISPWNKVVGGLTPVEGVRIWKYSMGFEPASGFSKLTPPQDEAWTVSAPTPASGAPSSLASARSDRKSPTKPAPAGSGAYQRRSAGAGAARCCKPPPGSEHACGHSRDRAPRPDAYRPSHTCARKSAPLPRHGSVAGDAPAARGHAAGSHSGGREPGCPGPPAQIRTCALTHTAPTLGD